ncbi:MAG: hypothetical protein F4099_03390 [Synechococcus sp. SB0673_bin_10]|nr:hypothetical protein [Synechococcus sp. SB0667_bin_8]MYG63715.1 hypothetical protein [Synechococcus sp. SB0675_bin_7]MYI71557.1 hypothetical protein [Synechococcus sp. SB0673_bin_10]MYK86333.1 hypothetical protein [Synechococcus sp. SB0669_bin_7]
MKFPFEVSFEELQADLDIYIDAVFSCLTSEFLVMPKGKGFVEFAVFEEGYECLKRATGGFREVTPETLVSAVYDTPIVLVVLRCMIGFTPPEWAYYASHQTGISVTQNAARAIDRNIRMDPQAPLPKPGTVQGRRIGALISAGCHALTSDVPRQATDTLHRLDKADTRAGLVSVRASANLGVPYSVLLYERLLGRPFAGHRDSISELIGNVVENAIEAVLTEAGIRFRKTGRAERLEGFDQAPDFVVPNQFNPRVVIEPKLTEDDGTARDKVTRVQHLGSLSMAGQPPGKPGFQVVACIAGRGFGVRREDMKKLLLATRGKVFTLKNIPDLVDQTLLRDFRAIPPAG